MRKRLILFLGLILLSAAVLAVGVGTIDAGRDDIIVTQQTLQGDCSAAQGLQVAVLVNENRNLIWNTTFAATAAERAETEFAFYNNYEDAQDIASHRDIYLNVGNVNFGMHSSRDLLDEESVMHRPHEMLLPAKDVASRTPNGETRTEQLQLNRFYPYYPIGLDSNWIYVEPEGGMEQAVVDALTDCFRIPVPDSHWVEISVTKDDVGHVVEIYSEDVISEEPSYTYGSTVCTDDAVYLMISGNQDYSQFRDGYGLYRIPLVELTSWGEVTFFTPQTTYDVEHMELVYAMDPVYGNEVTLRNGMDERELLLFEQTEDGMRMLVIDTETAELCQTMELNWEHAPNVWYHEDLMILGDRDHGSDIGLLQVYQKVNDRYELWLDTDFYPLNEEGYLYNNIVFAFDGTRLAIADFTKVYSAASLRILVYDANGLCYAGEYHFSCDELTEPLSTFNLDKPLQISWIE